MSRRRGPTLAERSAMGTPTEVGADPDLAALQDRPRPVLTRHCWVTGLPDCPGRWAGLLAEWRQDTNTGGGWQGRVVYTVDDGMATVMVEAWLPAPAPAASGLAGGGGVRRVLDDVGSELSRPLAALPPPGAWHSPTSS